MKPSGETRRKKNIIRERGRLETEGEMERRVLERKSIVLNRIPNMGNLAEIRFSKSTLPWEKLKVLNPGQAVIVTEVTPLKSTRKK